MRYYLYGKNRDMPNSPAYDEYLDAAHTAVISLDMHEGHLSESPDCPCPAPRAREIVGSVDLFHAQCRAAGVPIVHVRSNVRASGADDLNGISSAWRLGFAEWVGGIPNAKQHALEGTPWTQFCTKVDPMDEVVATKKRLSAFYPTDLDFLLRQMKVSVVVLDGAMTDCCILSTAFDASNRNYRVITARDLVRGTNDELEDAALKIMSLNTGLVMDSAEILAAWREAAVAPPATDHVETSAMRTV